ncbi:MAG TPA: copper resistance CopC family protein [Alphaproteobacteria bacterium]|jgi:methionine-rich copper-binding protein CopC|nr:copper resistance CopC family protein [Alphaproteobacteria bacterium]
MFFPLMSRTAAMVLALGIAQVLGARVAHAHAVIIDSSPAVNATVSAGDVDVSLHYNSRIDHQRSRLTLIAGEGKSELLAIVPDSAPDVVAAKITGLTPGQYRLRWQVLAVDGHLTRGDIPFSVKAP